MPRPELDVKGKISMDRKRPERLYRIGDLADLFGVTPRTIRYYEELGLIEPAERSEGAHRRYAERSLIHLKRIQQLKDYGLSLADIQELFELARKDRSGSQVRRRLAEKYREKLEEAERRKAALECYMEDLSWHIDQVESAGEDFFQCPGASCGSCRFAERCDVRLLIKVGSA